MGITRLRQAAGIVAGLIAIVASSATQAQTPTQAWPQRPVKFIVPFGPGAGADIGARLLSDRLATRWGKSVVVENRPGADSLVAIQAMVGANDDHTLFFGPSGSFTVHPYQYEKLPYAAGDLVPLARVSITVLGLAVPASMNINTLAEFVARARAEPGKFNAAVVPGITEFTFDYFVKTAGLSVQKVPYRDIVQAVTDLGEGRLQVYMASYAILRPQSEAGRIKTLVTTGRERPSILPQIPTGIESGFPALDMEGLVGLFGPKSMANDLRDRIGADVVAAVGDPAVSERLAATAQVVAPGGTAEFAASIERQRQQVATIAQALGMKPKLQQ